MLYQWSVVRHFCSLGKTEAPRWTHRLLVHKQPGPRGRTDARGAHPCRAQARSRGARPLVQGLHLLSHPFFPLEPAFPWAARGGEGKRRRARRGSPDHTDLGNELLGRTDTGSTGDTETCGEERVSLIFAGPVCCLAPLSIPTSFGKSVRHRGGKCCHSTGDMGGSFTSQI